MLHLQQKKSSALFVYIYDSLEKEATGEAGKWWLHKSLLKLQHSLKDKFDINLIVITEEADLAIKSLIKKYNINEVVWNRLYSQKSIKRDSAIKKSLLENNIEVQTFNAHLLNEPWEVQNNSGQYFKVFTPYWRKAYEVYQSKKYQIKDIINIKPLKHQEKSSWNFLPQKKWYLKFEDYWMPGEDAALSKLTKYIHDDIDHYKQGRDRPDLDQTSKLSPHLRFGEISPRKIVNQIVKSKKQNISVTTFLSEIGWREFSYSLLYYSKDLAKIPINEKFLKFPWRKSEKDYQLWKNAKTGVPLIDAAMKQIYEKGWMHNRLRMVVGSFLVKNLLLNWTLGEKYFHETLLDYDEASNAAGWQWIAGCGADAAPYFRVFNPILQSERFDPKANFILEYIPQLKNLKKPSLIFQPHLEENFLRGLVEEKQYFSPMVDLKDSRNRALEAYQRIKT